MRQQKEIEARQVLIDQAKARAQEKDFHNNRQALNQEERRSHGSTSGNRNRKVTLPALKFLEKD